MQSYLSWGTIGFGVLAAFLGLYAAWGIEIRNNQDMFIHDLAAQSRYAGFAAASAAVAAILQAVEKLSA